MTHVFMDVSTKETAKVEFGFTAVPFYVIVDKVELAENLYNIRANASSDQSSNIIYHLTSPHLTSPQLNSLFNFRCCRCRIFVSASTLLLVDDGISIILFHPIYDPPF